MWLWVMNFIVGLGQMTLAGAFASYYWAFDKRKDIPVFPVSSSFGRSLRYAFHDFSGLNSYLKTINV